jgi:hypothetical protein
MQIGRRQSTVSGVGVVWVCGCACACAAVAGGSTKLFLWSKQGTCRSSASGAGSLLAGSSNSLLLEAPSVCHCIKHQVA